MITDRETLALGVRAYPRDTRVRVSGLRSQEGWVRLGEAAVQEDLLSTLGALRKNEEGTPLVSTPLSWLCPLTLSLFLSPLEA